MRKEKAKQETAQDIKRFSVMNQIDMLSVKRYYPDNRSKLTTVERHSQNDW